MHRGHRYDRTDTTIVTAALLALALLALAMLACRREEPAPPPARQAVTIPAAEIATVRTGTVSTGPLISGTLEASRGATLTARLGGTILEVGPEIGEHVRPGVLLARIDPSALTQAMRSAEAQVASAETALEVATREVERTRALAAAGAIARRELDLAVSRREEAAAALAQARAQQANAREQLADATVRAPLAGVVARRAVKVGDVVAVGNPLYELIDPTSLRLSAAVPSDQVAGLRPGVQVRFSVRGFPEHTFLGRVTRVAPAADPTTRQIPILVEIPNPTEHLLAGLFAQGRLELTSQSGLVIPASAVDTAGQTKTVIRVTRGVVERVPVELGLVDELNDMVVVTKGLAAGDRILVRAATAPPPGTPITTS